MNNKCKIGVSEGHLHIDCGNNQIALEKEILRIGMIAELDAVSLYEQLANASQDIRTKTVFLDIAKEEKTHMGEFQELLLNIDKEQKEELDNAREEVTALLS